MLPLQFLIHLVREDFFGELIFKLGPKDGRQSSLRKAEGREFQVSGIAGANTLN
jgi:hypothetical protein